MKLCNGCKIPKKIDQFSKSQATRDGLQASCKSCQSLYASERRKNKPEQEKARHCRYRKNNAGKINFRAMKRHSAKLLRTPKWLTPEQLFAVEFMYLCSKEFTKQTGVEYHVDHIVPLQGENVSGLHVPWNLRCITAEANRKKSNKVSCVC